MDGGVTDGRLMSQRGSACGGRDNLLQTVNTVNLRRANQPLVCFNCRFTYMYSSPPLPPHLRPHQPPHVLFARAIGPHLYVHVWKDTWPTTCGTQAVDRQTAGSDATKTLTQRSPVIWRKTEFERWSHGAAVDQHAAVFERCRASQRRAARAVDGATAHVPRR